MKDKLYKDLEELLGLEHELAVQDRCLEAFLNVKRGKRFSLEDLQIVQSTLSKQSAVLSEERDFDLADTIVLLRDRVIRIADQVVNAENKLIKNGFDLAEIGKERTLENYRQQVKKENVLEKRSSYRAHEL